MSSTCSGFAAASSAGPGYSPNSSGVTMFTRLSVVCALNTVATSSSKGELKFNAHFGCGNLHAQLLVFLMHARDPRLLRFPRHASSLPLACGRTRKTYGNVAIGKNSENPSKKRQKISKATGNQRKANAKQTKPVEHQRNDRKKKVSFRRTRREPHPWPRPHAHPLPADRNDSRRCARCR